MTMENINTLHQFLQAAGVQYQVFDMGRRVTPIDPIEFAQIEAMTTPYPYPRNGHAWLGILFWNPQESQQHFIWFLKLPVDEQGLLNPAARSQFLQTVVDGLGRDPTAPMTEAQQEGLKSNPFIFAPGQEKLAVFHARVNLQLARPASIYFEHCQSYLKGQMGWDNWQQVGLQGLADILARLTKQQARHELPTAIGQMPPQPLAALASVAENFPCGEAMADAWLHLMQDGSNDAINQMVLRGLAGADQALAKAIDLALPHASADTLVVIAARCWGPLAEPQRMMAYLERLATEDKELFVALYSDLVSMPSLRQQVLTAIRTPQRSTQLAAAIGHLMQLVRA
ncbi:DUF3549 family protein [Ferrimonas sp. SCSIO 43195]|uniref:DUF3549 family protein n=1 Tax=Ferrimonas sp. SCSIO 43195 TaxID=2822844 RepID=UPI002075F4B0|nr:DUF3549 family protein [Ferrimonas sp. SCSIO 43195]USD36785.1 DUF3549 family protein [Ferrimonas sp. SCSIO 43195]